MGALPCARERSPRRPDAASRWNPWRPPRAIRPIDRHIREAQEAGKFDQLPYRGERIPLEDDSLAGEWALAHHILKNAHVVPPWIATDQEVRELLGRRDAILDRATRSSSPGRKGDRADLERVVGEVNRAIAILDAEAPTDRQHRRPLDLATELAALEAAHLGRADRP